MITIPAPFIAAARNLLDPSYRIHNGCIEAWGLGSDVIITATLSAPHPDTDFFGMRKWPSMDEGSLTIVGDTLRYKYKGFSQNTAVNPSREFAGQPTVRDEMLARIIRPAAAPVITPDCTSQLAACSPYQSTDETRYVLNGIYCTSDFVATDGRRLLMLSSPYTGTPFIMHTSIVDALLALHRKKPSSFWRWIEHEMPFGSEPSDDPEKTPPTKKFIKIETDSFSILFPPIEGNYPNYHQVIPPTAATDMLTLIPAPAALGPMATWLRGRKTVALAPVAEGIIVYDTETKSHAVFDGYLTMPCCYNGTYLQDLIALPGFSTVRACDEISPAIANLANGIGILMPHRLTVDPSLLADIHLLAS